MLRIPEKYNSPKLIYSILYLIILSTAVLESGGLFGSEIIYNGYDNTVKHRILDNCSDLYPKMNRGMLSWYMVCSSEYVFGNARVVPFLFSIGLIPMTFLLARKMSNSYIIGLLSSAALAINPVFLVFDDSAAYHQFWVFFLLCSLYFGYKYPVLSGPFLIISVASKSAALLFVPSMIFLFWKNKTALISTGLCLAVVTLYSISGRPELVQNLILKPLDTQFGAYHTFWIFTKHAHPIMMLVIPIGAAIAFYFKEYRIGAAISASLIMYFGVVSSTILVTFPYHTIPIMIFMNIGYAIGLHKLYTIIQTRINRSKINKIKT